MKRTERPYSPKEVILDLDIGDSTLRKWCIALEEAGYSFSRTNANKRLFFERDLIVLKTFRNLVQVQNMSMQNASIIVASKYKDLPSLKENDENNVTEIGSMMSRLQELTDKMKSLEEQNKELLAMNIRVLEQLESQQRYIEERMEERDSLLMQSIRETQETKKLLLEAEEKQKRKGIFRFFKG